jgi:hypothetical protein
MPDKEWSEKAKAILKAELKRRNVGYRNRSETAGSSSAHRRRSSSNTTLVCPIDRALDGLSTSNVGSPAETRLPIALGQQKLTLTAEPLLQQAGQDAGRPKKPTTRTMILITIGSTAAIRSKGMSSSIVFESSSVT